MARWRSPIILLALFLLSLVPLLRPAQAQSLPLPADLFVLSEAGRVLLITPGSEAAAPITPVEQNVVDFAVAPDGQWIAYRSAGDAQGGQAFIAISAVNGLSGQVLEFDAPQPPITGRGQTVAWSPDAAIIAYTTPDGLRVFLGNVGGANGTPTFQSIQGGPFLNLIWSPGGGYLAAEADNNAWFIYRRDVTQLAYAGQVPASAGIAWLREGVLALAPPGGGLVALDIASGAQTALIGEGMIVSQPTLIGGNRLIFMLHEANGQRFAARRFGTVSTSGGAVEEIEASLELTAAMRWLPDGVALLATLDGTLTVIEPRTNTRRELLTGVKGYAWGPLPPVEITGTPLPTPLYFLMRDDAGVAQLWRLPADGGAAVQLTNEARNVLDYALSPDGTQIAYTSGGALRAMHADGSGGSELSVAGSQPGAGAMPAWSPDGSQIAFARDGIWLVPAAGGPRTELITDVLGQDTPPGEVRVYLRPRWDPSGTRLLINIGYYEGLGLGVLPVAGGTVQALPTLTQYGDWLPNGQIIAWDFGVAYAQPGLYLVDPATPDAYTTVLNDTHHVLDTVVLANEAVVILRGTAPDMMGPNAVQPFLVPVLPDALPIPHGQGGLIEAPALAPGGRWAAGLREARYGDFGQQGRLLLVNLETGERYAIDTAGEVWGIQWQF